MEKGAATAGHKEGREGVIAVLNQVLATEIVCVLGYKRDY